MTTVVIDRRCTACGQCLITCPTRALVPAPQKPAVVDRRCNGCGACIEICPTDAISEVGVLAICGVYTPQIASTPPGPQ